MPGSSGRPRILRIITRLNIGGPSIQAARLTTELRPLGYDTWLVHGRVAPSEGTMCDLLPADDPAVHFVDCLQRPIAPLDDLAAFRAIYSIVTTVRPDIVHTHMAKAGLLGRAATVLYNRRLGRRRACIVHTYHGHVLEGYFKPALSAGVIQAERRLARHTDRLIAISPRVADELVEQYRIAPRQKFAVIPLGFDLRALASVDASARIDARRTLNIPFDAFVVTTVGRLTAIKNHELFLEAARGVAAAIPSALFLIAGDGDLRGGLEMRAASLGIADRVRFLGWRRDLPVLYGATDVLMLTSRNEGTPVALIEAMAAAVPGVAPDVGGVGDVISGPEIGVLVAPEDATALVSAVVRLNASPQTRLTMGERARASVIGRYDASRLVRDIDRVYRDLLAG